MEPIARKPSQRPVPGPTALRIRHATTYRYSQPVRFGEHRVRFRPREEHDVFSNSVAVVIGAMMAVIRDGFQYQAREAEGTQPAARTLYVKAGTRRDYAWLMIEAPRSIGIACRFVTGYIYDPSLDPGGHARAFADARTGSGATHAWPQVYLPGAGWVPFDPDNRLTGGLDLIRVGYSRRPQQAVPLPGSWFGESGSFLGMQVEVAVERA